MNSRETRVHTQTSMQSTEPASGSVRIDLSGYPELQPILLLAVDAAIFTFAIDAEAERDLVVHLEEGSLRLCRGLRPDRGDRQAGEQRCRWRPRCAA